MNAQQQTVGIAVVTTLAVLWAIMNVEALDKVRQFMNIDND